MQNIMECNKLKSFKNLLVWQKVSGLAVFIYSITEKFPKSELYGITNQIRRSVISVSSNIAESFKRNHYKEKLQFYNVASASISELESQIEISYKIKFIDHDDYEKLCGYITKVGKIINGLMKSTNINSKSYILKPVFLLFFLISISYILNPINVFASKFSFDILDKNISINQQFKIDLNINTEKENINAVEGKIIFLPDYLELSEIREGNSVVNFWVEKPVFKDGEIVFSGITPGGYILDKGLIFSLIFKAKKQGNSLIKIENGNALKNDGNGTKSILKTSDLQINISGANQKQEDKTLEIIDKEMPDTFQPEVSQDSSMFDNQWFLVFIDQDKGSGIDKYEVKESKYNLFDFSKWVKTESPYLLIDQELQSNIFVKAYDKAGNVRIVKLSPKNPISWYANFENWFITVSVIATALIYFFLSKKL
ncbi:MAG: four helix bundle protein [bacterium]